jgi:hypothetical protein
MFRRGLLTAAIAAVLLATTALPAQAAVQIPPGGDVLVVFAYYTGPDKQVLVGQEWWGCNTSGSWGTTGFRVVYFTPC